jgi:plasmid stabilization system protein ParE
MRCSRERDGIVPLYNVLPARGVVRDFTLIEDFLFKTYRDLGDDPEEAGGRAAARIKAARAYMRTFERNPHRGTEHPEIRPGVRTVTDTAGEFAMSLAPYFRLRAAAPRSSKIAAEREPS